MIIELTCRICGRPHLPSSDEIREGAGYLPSLPRLSAGRRTGARRDQGGPKMDAPGTSRHSVVCGATTRRRFPLPVAADGERPLPDAWRDVPGRPGQRAHQARRTLAVQSCGAAGAVSGGRQRTVGAPGPERGDRRPHRRSLGARRLRSVLKALEGVRDHLGTSGTGAGVPQPHLGQLPPLPPRCQHLRPAGGLACLGGHP